MFTSSYSIYLQLIVTLTLCSPQDIFTLRKLVFIYENSLNMISGRAEFVMICLAYLSLAFVWNRMAENRKYATENKLEQKKKWDCFRYQTPSNTVSFETLSLSILRGHSHPTA